MNNINNNINSHINNNNNNLDTLNIKINLDNITHNK
jgi:hypothetical protein